MLIYNCYEKDNIIYLVYSKNGKLLTETAAFNPALYFPTQESKDVKYRSMQGKPLKKKLYRNCTEYTVNMYNHKNKKEEFYGDIDPKYQFIIQKFLDKKMEVEEVKIYNYDIEAFSLSTDEFMLPEEAKAPVQTITIQEYHTKKYYVFGYKDFLDHDIEVKDDDGKIIEVIPKESVIYTKCRTEVELLRKFVNFLRNKQVQVITGWNILHYDNQYIFNRLRRLGIEKEFVDSCIEYGGGVKFGYMQNLDYMEIYKKLIGENKPGFSLNEVSKDELNTSKIDIDGFRDTYRDDFQNFVKYNIQDTTLVSLLEDKLQFITLMFSMAATFRCLPEDILHVTRYWNTYIFSYALSQGIIVDATEDRPKIPYVGGYVFEPKLGLSRWSVMYDIVSSYPRAIRAHNISPETLVSYNDLPKDLYLEVNKHLFDIMFKVYEDTKDSYRTESGSVSIISGKNDNPKKFHVLALNHQFADNNGLMDRIQYPHFVLFSSTKDIKENERCKKVEQNKYFYLAKDKKDLIYAANNLFSGHDSLMVIDHTFLTLGLIEYFKMDYNRFEPFEKMIKRENFIITPNLQFFKKTKTPGILAQCVETIFFERLIAKTRSKVDDSFLLITKHFLDHNFFITKESLIEYGISKIPEDERKELISILKTKDINQVEKLRDKYQHLKTVDKVEDRSKKTAIVGVYGATANEGFRFNDIRICESITSCAQLGLRGTAQDLENKNLTNTLYGDTDSTNYSVVGFKEYETDEETHSKLIEQLVSVIEPEIEVYNQSLMNICNTRNVPIEFEREAIVKRSLFTGKKHYFWWLYEFDGKIYKDKPKYKTRGLDTRKSATPKWVSKLLESFLIKTLNDVDQKDLINYIKAAEKHFHKLSFHDIGKAQSVAKLKEYKGEMKSSLLPQYKGAITYNNWLKKNDKSKKYEEIKSGKVRWVYVKKNKYGTNAISLPDKYHPDILKEFEIDYDLQFKTVVMAMVEQVFKACNWSLDDRKRVF